jgi:hypothetical protein
MGGPAAFENLTRANHGKQEQGRSDQHHDWPSMIFLKPVRTFVCVLRAIGMINPLGGI